MRVIKHARMDVYLQHLSRDKQYLPSSIRYVVLDGYYAKNKFINGVLDESIHALSRLRHDAHLRWRYTVKQKPLGQPKEYDGKVIFAEHLERFEQQELDTAIVNSPPLKVQYPCRYFASQRAA